jgi:hypothetical protein
VSIRPAGGLRNQGFVVQAGGMGGMVQRTFSGKDLCAVAIQTACSSVHALQQQQQSAGTRVLEPCGAGRRHGRHGAAHIHR